MYHKNQWFQDLLVMPRSYDFQRGHAPCLSFQLVEDAEGGKALFNSASAFS